MLVVSLGSIFFYQFNSMVVIYSHIFHEGNYVADRLATSSVQATQEQWWHSTLNFIQSFIVRDLVLVPRPF